MSGFDDWLIDYTDNDDWCDRDITKDMEFAYNAGMERAAEIGNNILPSKLGNPVHGYTCGYNDGWYRYQEAIRKEIEK